MSVAQVEVRMVREKRRNQVKKRPEPTFLRQTAESQGFPYQPWLEPDGALATSFAFSGSEKR